MSTESLRVGVFVCDCGMNIAGTVDTAEVARFAETLPDVVAVVGNRYTCADPGQNEIRNAIAEHKLNRVVIASCTPKIHEPTFRQCVADAGLNPYLMEMANIREHCSWVHFEDKEAATDKAKDLVRSAVSRVRLLQAQDEKTFPVTDAALVIGGGNPSGVGSRGWRTPGLPRGEGGVDRRFDGRARQNLPHDGLLHMNTWA